MKIVFLISIYGVALFNPITRGLKEMMDEETWMSPKKVALFNPITRGLKDF